MCSVAAFDVLSRVVEQFASHGGSVQHVEATTDETTGGLHATLDLPVPLDGDADATAITPRTATMTADGGLEVVFSGFDAAALPGIPAATVTDRSARVAEDRIVMTVELAIDPDDDTAAAEAAAAASTESNRDATTEDREPPATEHTEGATDDTGPMAGERSDGATGAAETETAEAPDPTTGSTDATADEPSDLAARLDAVRDDSVPPYEDTEYLQTLYDACETFTEMSRHIQMDVVSETVRRYMIEAGIHDPTPYNTAAADATATAEDDAGADTAADDVSGESDGMAGGPDDATVAPADGGQPAEDDGDSSPAGMEAPSTGERTATADEAEMPDEQLMADGVGLPEHLSVGDVVTAVVESVTVYEVQRRLGLGQRRTRELLEQLDLLDLVLHRVAADPGEVTRDDVVARIRRRAGA